MQEALVAIEDYVHGVPGKLTLVATTALGYGLMIVGVFAIARMAL
jgi:succinate dehydrogenase / fumarate reductase membrane anchor subunit